MDAVRLCWLIQDYHIVSGLKHCQQLCTCEIEVRQLEWKGRHPGRDRNQVWDTYEFLAVLLLLKWPRTSARNWMQNPGGVYFYATGHRGRVADCMIHGAKESFIAGMLFLMNQAAELRRSQVPQVSSMWNWTFLLMRNV